MKQADYDALLQKHEDFVRKLEGEMNNSFSVQDPMMSDGYLRERVQSPEFAASLRGKDKLTAVYANQML